MRQNKEAIRNNKFGIIYAAAQDSGLEPYEISTFTELMYNAGIDILATMKKVPDNFLYESDWEGFEIPEHITHIGRSAFDSCTNFKHIVIPKNVRTVDNYAFYSCDQLTSLEIKNPDIIMASVGFNNFIPVIRFNGTLNQWKKFIDKCQFGFLECNQLHLLNRTILNYRGEKDLIWK